MCWPLRAESTHRLHEAMRYAVLGGGKRVRALLAYAGGELAAADPDVVDGAAAARRGLIHAYSLVHDDLPCMDNDLLRRGKPACHVAYGEAIALLAGDALQSLAFEALAARPMRDPSSQFALLARAAGAARDGGRPGDRSRQPRERSSSCLNSNACTDSKQVRSSGRRFASARGAADR